MATPLTLNQVFDLVAPIAIYHAADVCYKRRARSAIGKLWNHHEDPIVVERIGQAQSLADLLEYMEFKEPEKLNNIVDVYNDLFHEIVKEEKPEWEPYVDKWGALGFRDERRQHVFAGDSQGLYPLYEEADLIIERISHEQENA